MWKRIDLFQITVICDKQAFQLTQSQQSKTAEKITSYLRTTMSYIRHKV